MIKKGLWIFLVCFFVISLPFVMREVLSRCMGMDGRIHFYGKVIDPDGNPVEDARISYMKVEAFHFLPFSGFKHGPRHEVKSDRHGLFHIKGGRGVSLQI